MMRNPFRTEAEAFRFVWLTIVYFALIVIASVINTWLGLGVFIGETAIVAWWVITHGRATRSRASDAARTRGGRAPDPRDRERDRRRRGAARGAQAPGPRRARPGVRRLARAQPKLRHWVSDEDGARIAAQNRLDESLEAMRAAGIEARGQIGDSDPLQAIEDGIRMFAPDELVISTHPEGRSNWLERGIVEATRERFASPWPTWSWIWRRSRQRPPAPPDPLRSSSSARRGAAPSVSRRRRTCLGASKPASLASCAGS